MTRYGNFSDISDKYELKLATLSPDMIRDLHDFVTDRIKGGEVEFSITDTEGQEENISSVDELITELKFSEGMERLRKRVATFRIISHMHGEQGLYKEIRFFCSYRDFEKKFVLHFIYEAKDNDHEYRDWASAIRVAAIKLFEKIAEDEKPVLLQANSNAQAPKMPFWKSMLFWTIAGVAVGVVSIVIGLFVKTSQGQ